MFSLFCYALLCVHSSSAILFKRKRKLVALLLLNCKCIVTTSVMWLFLLVPWVGLQCVIEVFPDHTHLLFMAYTAHGMPCLVQNSTPYHFLVTSLCRLIDLTPAFTGISTCIYC